MREKPTVAVLGGGVGGLSAAHELGERGFSVTVYERRDGFGGKARSIPVPDSGTGGRLDLPGEHGFRFFPGFYRHVIDTMRRIPFGKQGASCYDNLTVATRTLLARAGKAETVWVTRLPQTIDDFQAAFLELFTDLDIPIEEVKFFVKQILGLATSCEARYLAEFEPTPFWDFIGAAKRSEHYQRYLGQGFTRSLVAMRAEESSTRTIGRIILQIFYSMLLPGQVMDRLLNGPTNDVWIDPWCEYLTTRLGVRLEPGASVQAFHVDSGQLARGHHRAGRTTARGHGRLLCLRATGGGHATAGGRRTEAGGTFPGAHR